MAIITKKSQAFLEKYLNNTSPTGAEAPGQKLWIDYIKPYVDEWRLDNYGTAYGIINPDRRLLAGNSAGGYGTLRFVLKEPKLFDAAILLSPAAYEPLPPEVSSSRKVEAFEKEGKFNDSIWRSYSYVHRIDSFLLQKERPKFYLSSGDDDNYNIVPVVTSLQQLFLENNVPNELRVMDGGHDWQFWRKSFVNFLTDYYAGN